MGTYEVVDLTAPTGDSLKAFGGIGEVDVDKLRDQLLDIRNSLAPLTEENA